MNIYRLHFDVGEGAINPNPVEYSSEAACRLLVPLRPGYRFVGWTGEGIETPQPYLEIPAGSEGDRSYTAHWCEIGEWTEANKHPLFGGDDGLLPRPSKTFSTPQEKGDRGENVYLVKTVYTDILIDAVKDAAYDYGLHLGGELPSDAKLHAENPVRLELWMIRGQDGRAYAYGEVTDADLEANEELFAFKAHHCDSVHFYVELGNMGMSAAPLGLIIGSEEPLFAKKRPENCAVRRTDFGFAFEVAFDNQGDPFYAGDEIGFAIYYNNTNEYHSTSDYKHLIVKLPSAKNPAGDAFHMPKADDNDTVRFSIASATGLDANIPRPEKCGDLLRDALSGASTVGLVYDSMESAHTVLCGRHLRTLLAMTGGTANVHKELPGRTPPSEEILVLMGRTSHAESRAMVDLAPYNAFGLSFAADRILLMGWKEKAMKASFGLLESALAYVKAGGSSSDLAAEYWGELPEIPVLGVPRMEELSLVTDAGSSAYLLLAKDRPTEAFDDYRARLEEEGLTLYTENVTASVRAATYFNDEIIVNVTYSDADRSLRAVVDVRQETGLPPIEVAPYKKVTTSRITQLSPIGVMLMCYAIRLDNGEYIMIDAGGNGASQYLHDAMLRLNGGAPITVAAWIFTHFHCDHIGGLLDLMEREELRRDFVIKRIVHNFPQKQVLDTASAGDQKNLQRWPNVVRLSGAEVIHARTGQKYRLANAEIEMLFTFEDLAPFHILADRTNPTSHIFLLTIEGQRFIITGDACGEASRLVVDRYGDALKADFVQLPHHGYGDGGTSPAFYERINARWILLPAHERMNASPAERRAMEAAERFFRNGDRDTTLLLPYDGEEPD